MANEIDEIKNVGKDTPVASDVKDSADSKKSKDKDKSKKAASAKKPKKGKIVAVVVGLYYYVVYRRSGYLYPALDVGVGCEKLVPVRVYRSIHERSNVDLLGLILTCGGVCVERVVVRVYVNETVLGDSSDIGDLRVGALIRAHTRELRDQHADGSDENHDRHYQYDLAHLFAAGVIRLRERRIAEPRPAGLRPALYFILLLWGFMRLGVKIQLIDRDIP